MGAEMEREIAKIEAEKNFQLDKMRKEQEEMRRQLTKEMETEKGKYERIVKETQFESDYKWSLAAGELKDSGQQAAERGAEVEGMLGVQEALKAEIRKLRRTVAKASSAAAEGMSVAGADWSSRRKRLVEWQA